MNFTPAAVSMLPAIPSLVALGAFFALVADMFKPLFSIFMKLFELIPLLFNPVRLVNEVISGITLGFTFLVSSIFDHLNPHKYLGTRDKKKKKDIMPKSTCYSLNFINIIILVICPPFAIFQKYGWDKFWEVIICAFLSVYCYYIPGFLYALLLVVNRKKEGKCL